MDGQAFICKACLLSNDACQRNGNLAETADTKCAALLVKDELMQVQSFEGVVLVDFDPVLMDIELAALV